MEILITKHFKPDSQEKPLVKKQTPKDHAIPP